MEGRERIAPHRKRLPFGAVEIGLGIDSRYALSQEEHRTIAQEAAALGYQSLWTPIGSTREPFDLCVLWHESSGLGTGIAVAPISGWAIDDLAALAKETHRRCAGRFSFGVGSGRVTDAPIRAMRDAIGALRPRLPGVRIYLGALGPQMLHLAGESADGAALNWCSAEQVTWSRERVAEGARRAGREPRSVALHEYIRVCVDEDESAARTAFAKMALTYALAHTGADMAVHILGATSRAARGGGAIGQIGALAVLRRNLAGVVPLLHLAHSIRLNINIRDPRSALGEPPAWEQPIPSGVRRTGRSWRLGLPAGAPPRRPCG